METIARYSSDESSPEPHHVPCTSNKQPENPITPEKTTSSGSKSLEKKKTNISVEAQNVDSPPVHILSYLQEHSMNSKRQTSLFAFLPWYPSREVKSKLQSVGNLAMREMKKNVTNFDKRFTCNSVVSARSVEHGAFGITNKRSFTDLHISLFPNMTIPMHKLKQLTNNVLRLVKQLQIPPEILYAEQASALDQLLSDGKAGAKRKLRLKLDRRLHLYKLSKSGSLFVGIGLAKFSDWESKETLPQFHYLNHVSRAIEDEANTLDIPFRWLQFNTAQKGNRGDIRSLYYHFTLVICELNPRGQRMDDPEYLKTQAMLQKVDVAKLLRDIPFDVDHFVLRAPDKSTKIPLI